MSRYTLHLPGEANLDNWAEVVVGWDNPTQSFFCQLWRNADDDGAEVQTSSLPAHSPKTFGDLDNWCLEHGINIPVSVRTRLLKDSEHRTPMTQHQVMVRDLFAKAEREQEIEDNARHTGGQWDEEETEAGFDG